MHLVSITNSPLLWTCWLELPQKDYIIQSSLNSRHCRLNILCLTQYMRLSVQICAYTRSWRCLQVAELLQSQSHSQPSCIQKQSTLEENEELEPKPHNRTMMVPKFNVGLGLTEEIIKVFKATDVNKQPAAATRQLWEFLLAKRRFWKRLSGLCITRLQCMVASRHLQVLKHCHLYF